MHTICPMTLGQRFLRAREAKAISQSELARLLGVTRNAVSMWERDESQPKSKTMQKAAVILSVGFDWLATGRGGETGTVLGIPLWGEVAGGVWAEVRDSQDTELERVPVAPDPRYPADAQYALKIRGNSVNRIAKHGTIVICVDIVAAGVELRDGDLVWVERKRGSLVEATIKRLRKGKSGPELWPESDDPQFQEKAPLKVGKGHDEVVIRGLVLYTVNPVPRGD
jgi:transcriptional regulator with XRE-family HTH domain